MCDVQQDPLEFGGRLLSICGVVSSLVGVWLATRGRFSLSLVLGVLLSSCEGLHSTYFRELLCICRRSTSL